ncbi:MAG: TraR/DksA C4-type zinc finger protein [Gammaproteobacteria bacterium]|nr:TraR/DksA C4-type zinc finger protein [Gammaproteobacteria bacterium]MBT8134035.1 TraR/DksA C4-type zinc finger protein [Gammaproteobacteria bacterium]NNJ50659.1 TraR/DksA family transcriptional regulator [Gammaproteobacteria bacterium]
MNDDTVEQIRQQLLNLKMELQAQEQEYRDSSNTVELDQTRVGRLSRMDAMQAQQMALESARRRQHQMKRIEGALRRLESGEYGYCFVCGEEISAQRLAVEPTTTRCIECVE